MIVYYVRKMKRVEKHDLKKGPMKLQPQIIFVSPTKIDENTSNILNHCFSK